MNKKQALLATLIIALGSAAPMSAGLLKNMTGSCWVMLKMLMTRCKEGNCCRKHQKPTNEDDASRILLTPEIDVPSEKNRILNPGNPADSDQLSERGWALIEQETQADAEITPQLVLDDKLKTSLADVVPTEEQAAAETRTEYIDPEVRRWLKSAENDNNSTSIVESDSRLVPPSETALTRSQSNDTVSSLRNRKASRNLTPTASVTRSQSTNAMSRATIKPSKQPWVEQID